MTITVTFEQYHLQLVAMKHTILMFMFIWNFITLFNYNLSPFLQEGEGEDYVVGNKIQKSGTWATEMEILATAKMLHKDVYTWFNGQWLCYSYYHEPTTDAIYLDNSSECHFNVVLHP